MSQQSDGPGGRSQGGRQQGGRQQGRRPARAAG